MWDRHTLKRNHSPSTEELLRAPAWAQEAAHKEVYRRPLHNAGVRGADRPQAIENLHVTFDSPELNRLLLTRNLTDNIIVINRYFFMLYILYTVFL